MRPLAGRLRLFLFFNPIFIMSVRAYTIKKIEYENEEIFNLWHDQAFVDLLLEHTAFYSKLGDDASGFSELSDEEVAKLKKAAKEIKDRENRKLCQGIIKKIERKMKESGESHVCFGCF